MGENVGAGFDHRPGDAELGRVHHHAGARGVTLGDRRARPFELPLEVVAAKDEPDLDEIGPIVELAAHFHPGLLRRADLDHRRVAAHELGRSEGAQERPRHGHPGRQQCLAGKIPDLEVPKRPADIDHRRDAAGEVARKG